MLNIYESQADIKGAHKNKLIQYIQLFQYVHFHIGKFHFMGFKPHRVGNKGIFQIFHQLNWFCIKGKLISRVLTKTSSSGISNYFNMSIFTLESSIFWVLSPIVWEIKGFSQIFHQLYWFCIKGKMISRVLTKTSSSSLFNNFNLSILTLENSIFGGFKPHCVGNKGIF